MRPAAKQKKCRICPRKFRPQRMGQQCCSPNCAIQMARLHPEKGRKIARRKDREVTREKLEGLKTLNKLCTEAQRAVNLFVRIRDFGKGCISCDTGPVQHAGHFFAIGSKFRNNRLRFDTRAIHGQCAQCNHFLSGNPRGYEAGLVQRFGQQYVDMLYDLNGQAERGELEPLTREEVAAIKASYWKAARELGLASNAVALA